MNILIIGGGGFLGSLLENSFFAAGNKTMVLDTFLNNGPNSSGIKGAFITGNACSHSVIRSVFSSFRPDVVFHFADSCYDREGIYRFYDEQNTCNAITVNIARCVEEYPIKHLFFGSSCEVYRGGNRKGLKETALSGVFSFSGGTKKYSEEMFKLHSKLHNYTFTSLRYFQVYGKRVKINPRSDVISLFIESTINKQGVYIIGPDVYIDTLYIEDAISATELVVKNVLEGNKIENINIGSGKAISLLDLYKFVSNACSGETIPYYTRPPYGHVRSLVADISYIKSLGWEEKYTLESTIATIIENAKI